jgi:hypothetical protein
MRNREYEKAGSGAGRGVDRDARRAGLCGPPYPGYGSRPGGLADAGPPYLASASTLPFAICYLLFPPRAGGQILSGVDPKSK